MAKSRSSSARDKARRAQLSCYTCRQRKVKCDRIKPCSACVQYQDPEGCCYDISDDKRQPMLMADAYKQLRKENIELKAKAENNQTTITKCKAENALLKARLAATQTRNLQPSGNSRLTGLQIWFEYYSIPFSPAMQSTIFAKPEYGVQSTWHRTRSPAMDIDKPHSHQPLFQELLPIRASSCESVVQDHHESKFLSQAFEKLNVIISNIRMVDKTSERALQSCLQDLLMILNKLPKKFPFTLSGIDDKNTIVSSQAALVARTLHFYIITLLSYFGCRNRTGSTYGGRYLITLSKVLRCQFISSCIVALTLLQHFDDSDSKLLSNLKNNQQSCTGLVTIPRLDALSEAESHDTPLQQTVIALRKQGINKLVVPIDTIYIESFGNFDLCTNDHGNDIGEALLNSPLSAASLTTNIDQHIGGTIKRSIQQGTMEDLPNTHLIKHGIPVARRDIPLQELANLGNGQTHVANTSSSLESGYRIHGSWGYYSQQQHPEAKFNNQTLADNETMQLNQMSTFSSGSPNRINPSSHEAGQCSVWSKPFYHGESGPPLDVGSLTMAAPIPQSGYLAYMTGTHPSLEVDNILAPNKDTSMSSLRAPRHASLPDSFTFSATQSETASRIYTSGLRF